MTWVMSTQPELGAEMWQTPAGLSWPPDASLADWHWRPDWPSHPLKADSSTTGCHLSPSTAETHGTNSPKQFPRSLPLSYQLMILHLLRILSPKVESQPGILLLSKVTLSCNSACLHNTYRVGHLGEAESRELWSLCALHKIEPLWLRQQVYGQ